MDAVRVEIAPGTRIASYVLDRQVGHGGMAEVYLAHDEQLGRPVALKVLASALAADQAFRERFVRESRAAAAVDHPHIIPIYAAGDFHGVLFIAMRYVGGGDVRSLVRSAGPLAPGQAAAIITPVASALDAAHGRGLVHRDVKPHNMLLDVQPGLPDHVYLSDFGLAKGSQGTSGLTGTGQFLGTPDYCAPEQMRALATDGRADQYSLACAAFELLTGAPPFPRDQLTAVIWAHMSEAPPLLTSRRPELSAQADLVMARALSKDPAHRFTSCGDFAAALKAAAGLPSPRAGRAAIPALRHDPANATLAPAPAAAPGPTAAVYQGGTHTAVPAVMSKLPSAWPERRTARRTQRVVRRRGALAAAIVLVALAGGLSFVFLYGLRGGSAQGSSAQTRKPGIWSPARQVAGVDTPSNLGRVIGYPGTDLGVNASISCASPGDCSAVISTGAKVAAVAQTHGTWGAARAIPGLAQLNVVGDAQISQVSCAAPGACTVGGYYMGSQQGRYAFVADEAGGTWRPARQVPGMATLNAGKNAQVFSVSCAAAGTCAVGGYYDDASGSAQAFVADEVNGTWHAAQEVPGTADLNTGRAAEIDSVSCPSPGMCSAAGQYQDGWPARTQLFVVDEVNGSWDTAREVPGLAALNAGGNATIDSVSCAAPGQCSAGGSYNDGAGKPHAFLVDEVNGSWDTAREVPGLAALKVRGVPSVDSVSCASPGDCSAVGDYQDRSRNHRGFVVSENPER